MLSAPSHRDTGDDTKQRIGAHGAWVVPARMCRSPATRLAGLLLSDSNPNPWGSSLAEYPRGGGVNMACAQRPPWPVLSGLRGLCSAARARASLAGAPAHGCRG